jgi:hypothetical protein
MNYIKKQTLENTQINEIHIGNTTYKGRRPQFQFFNGQWIQTVKGVPFVRVD